MRKNSANTYNLVRISLYILLVGAPLRYLYDGFGMERSPGLGIAMLIAAGIIIALLEKLCFSKWRKKLDTFPAVTQGSMYHRTVDGYRSANDRAADKNGDLDNEESKGTNEVVE